MKRLTAWLERSAASIAAAPDPVPGWLSQWSLFGLALLALYWHMGTATLTLIVASTIVRVMRQIESERRKNG